MRVSTFRALTDNYFAREGSKIRTAKRRRVLLERLVFPMIGNMAVEDIKRSDIIRMLDKIEDENGPGQADVAPWLHAPNFLAGTKSDTTT